MCLKQWFAVYVTATLAGSLMRVQHTDANESNQLYLKLDRATATSLMIEVPCKPHCNGNMFWEYKANLSSDWFAPKTIFGHAGFDNTYILKGLQPDTPYHIRTRLKSLNTYTNILVARTCPERPPQVGSLQVAEAGAGWLEVQWEPPAKEQCESDLHYLVRYKAEGEPFAAHSVHGVHVSTLHRVRFEPSHPCAPWPRLFCLLLTDYVQPGRNHTVEVQVLRYGNESSNEVSMVQTTYGLAETSNNGFPNSQANDFCEGNAGVEALQDATFHHQTTNSPPHMPFWASVTGWGVAAALLLALIIIGVRRRCRCLQREEARTTFLSRLGRI